MDPHNLHSALYPILCSFGAPNNLATQHLPLSKSALETSGSTIFLIDALTLICIFYLEKAEAEFPPPKDSTYLQTQKSGRRSNLIFNPNCKMAAAAKSGTNCLWLEGTANLRWYSLKNGGSHNSWCFEFCRGSILARFLPRDLVFGEISVTGCATLRWHSLQNGDSYNLDVVNFVAALFWPVFVLWPSFRRNFGHGLCHLKPNPIFSLK